MNTTSTLLHLGLTTGELMLRGGAEVARVEDTVTRILSVAGAHDVSVIATPTGIYLTLSCGGELASAVRRVHNTSYDLSLVCAINQLSRDMDTTTPTLALARLEELSTRREPYSLLVSGVAAFLAGGAFTVLFKGQAVEAGVGAIGSWLVFHLTSRTARLGINRYAGNFAGGMAGGLSAAALSHLLGANLQPTVIGSILILVPGVLITNAVRDSISGDLLSGAARLVEAVLVTVSLSAGVGAALSLWALGGGGL